ncbi:hypothetical protein L9F63_022003, partial [Diploptera punctata]
VKLTHQMFFKNPELDEGKEPQIDRRSKKIDFKTETVPARIENPQKLKYISPKG